VTDGKPIARGKKFLYLNRKSPYGSIYALEALEVALIGAAFEQNVRLAFIDDGVYQLAKNQDSSNIGMKNYSSTFRALSDFGVQKVYVDAQSLRARGLQRQDLLDLKVLDETGGDQDLLEIVDAAELAGIMAGSDVVLSF
jgi:tRNA 2-thiouridine synthesizing protein C